ncbi:MAG: phosphatidylserine decarboxylase [Xanthomonadales bacterium]|nr:phosphatidylserine decarboxylase [Xanthomonadales bacterium]
MGLQRDLGVALQLMLPHQFLSRIVYYLMRWTWGPWKRLLIKSLGRIYKIDLSDALEPDPETYASFNAFFTRALRPDARPIESDGGALVSPADGRISQIGRIRDGRILQAKGLDYTVTELLGGHEDEAARFEGGGFATIYLSPRDYHRVHVPYGGRLRRSIHVPGRLFSVAPWTTESIPRLFARNERLALMLDTDQGPLAVILVGAIFVSSIETTFDGEVTPPYADRVQVKDYSEDQGPEFAVGAEIGRFNMGSTVIVLSGAALPDWDRRWTADRPIRMGQRMSSTVAGDPVETEV